MHDRFLSYLAGMFEGDELRAESIVAVAEEEVAEALNSYFGAGLESIYDLTDSEEITKWIRMVRQHPVLKNVDMNKEPRYTDVLTWYRQCLKHQPEPTAIRKTIFLEGEAEERLPEETRRRNKELRQACIDYYKRRHGGRVVCECCGFDFAKAYDIDDEYIEVHHLEPISSTDGEHEVNAETDLVPLCANCHRMIHHLKPGRGTCATLDELKAHYRGKKYS